MRREPVSRLRREQTGSDSEGNPLYAPVETALPPALFAPAGVSEPVEPGRDPVVTEPMLYWPKVWPDVDASDELKVRGRIYTVVGEPADWRGTRVGGMNVKLKGVQEGAA